MLGIVAASIAYATPNAGCANNTLAYWTPYFGSEAVVAGAAHFEYAFLFAPSSTQNGVTKGTMFICDQTTGMQASGPSNCTNTFSFDDSTCSLTYTLSDCQSKVQHEETDVEIDAIAYKSDSDTIEMTGKTHMPGWTNPAVYERVANPIKCPPAQ